METEKCPDCRPYYPCRTCQQKWDDTRVRREFIELCEKDGRAEKLRTHCSDTENNWDGNQPRCALEGVKDAVDILGLSDLLESEASE